MVPLTRRSRLKHATITGMALPLVSVARLGRAAANDKLRLAGIGVGGMGGADLAALSSHPQVEVVALCDVDAGNLAAAVEKHAGAKQFSDFRRMFDEFARGDRRRPCLHPRPHPRAGGDDGAQPRQACLLPEAADARRA